MGRPHIFLLWPSRLCWWVLVGTLNWRCKLLVSGWCGARPRSAWRHGATSPKDMTKWRPERRKRRNNPKRDQKQEVRSALPPMAVPVPSFVPLCAPSRRHLAWRTRRCGSIGASGLEVVGCNSGWAVAEGTRVIAHYKHMMSELEEQRNAES